MLKDIRTILSGRFQDPQAGSAGEACRYNRIYYFIVYVPQSYDISVCTPFPDLCHPDVQGAVFLYRQGIKGHCVFIDHHGFV